MRTWSCSQRNEVRAELSTHVLTDCRDAVYGGDVEERKRPDLDALRRQLDAANLPTLLLLLVQMTGDRRYLQAPFQPVRARGMSDNDSGGFDDQTAALIKTAAARAIADWQAGTPLAIPNPTNDELVHMISVALGEPVPSGFAPFIRQEIGIGRPTTSPKQGRDPRFAVIIGAGMSGICMSVNLAAQGIDHVLIERNDDVGGTWLENRYPGCGVDVPSHLYSYSFAPNAWTQWFALRDEIAAYFTRVANEFGVTGRTRFGTEVMRAQFDDAQHRWTLDLRTRDGLTEEIRADIVVSAVGAFNKPRLPHVLGMDSFSGRQAHTARWPADLDVAGKRVAVVGTGASAMQVVPAIAERASQINVFQRSPQWAAPFEKFRAEVPNAVQELMETVPLYAAWYRVLISWAFNDRVWPSLQKDESWPHPERSVNEINEGQRRSLTRYITEQLGDRADLLEKTVPTYPPFGKRMLLDNGWFRTLRRPNVSLYAESVTEVLPGGVVSESGVTHDADVIIWATGFDVVNFLVPIEIVGRSGRTLQEHWNGDDARAYLGTAIPDFPNFFVLYGPNTQFGHGGSLITVVERQVRYITDLLAQMRSRGVTVVEVRTDVHDEYNRRVDAAHEKMVWTHDGMDTYYRNSRGRVVVNNPFRMMDVWEWTEHANLDDYQTS
jgi:4-hydroxyacetophenone monooxygenase